MSFTVTVLGSSASSPDAGEACSGFLFQNHDTNLLVDCGSGTLGVLRRYVSVYDLTGIVITHFHPDHFIDLVPMRYGLRYEYGEPARPSVYVQPGGIDYLSRVGMGLRDNPEFFTHAYDLTEYDPSATLSIGSLSLSFQRTTHDIPTFAVAVADTDRRVVYTSDTQESAELGSFARNVDLLIAESTYPHNEAALPSGNHLTSVQAGELATRANAHRLMLTHFWPGIDRSIFSQQASSVFSGEVLTARSGLTVTV